MMELEQPTLLDSLENFGSEFPDDYWLLQKIPEEDQRIQLLKHYEWPRWAWTCK